MHQGCDFAEMPQKMVPKRPKRRVKAHCVHPIYDLSGKSTCLVVHFVHFWWISRSIFASPPKIVHHLLVRCSKIFQRCHKNLYHLVMTNIAMENPKKISGGLANAGKIIYFD